MTRGVLRIHLGASPGVGKTFAMLDEGWRRKKRGTDVVVGIVETHGRAQTQAQIRDLEIIPRSVIEHRGTTLTEMDLDAVLARKPALVLVDELAHTNAPTCRNHKRWQDVDELLAAGIDVLSTVNIQHLESLNDVVAQISGIVQTETVPDAFVRSATQIELVDMTPEAVRRRLAHGNIYPAERIDAALTNFFKVANLAALRELALLWVADRVEDSVRQVADMDGKERSWETRERVVVGIPGATSGDALLRRAARIANRSRGELIVVRVVGSEGLVGKRASELAATRRLVLSLGGRYHEVVGDDVIGALLTFARSEKATQLIVGSSSRRGARWWPATPFVSRLVARSGQLDVHVISVPDEASPGIPRLHWLRGLVGAEGSNSWLGFVAAIVGPILLTAALVPFRSSLDLASDVLAFLGVALATAVISGRRAALLCTFFGFGLLNWFFTPPIGTLTIAEPENIATLLLFIIVTIVVGTFVDRAATRGRDATRARADAEALARSSAVFVESDDPIPVLLDHVRTTFGFKMVAVRETETGEIVRLSEAAESQGNPGLTTEQLAKSTATQSEEFSTFAMGRDHGKPAHELVVCGAVLTADQMRVLDVLADQISVAIDNRGNRESAARAKMLEGIDTARTALLRSVSHDLRTPLAAIKAFISGLRQEGVMWGEEEVKEIYAGIENQTDRLESLVSNLLDASRLEAGVLAVNQTWFSLGVAIQKAVESTNSVEVELDIDEDLPMVHSDEALLERAIANLVSNAIRHGGGAALVRGRSTGDAVEVDVIDHGPGVAAASRDRILNPFQRLNDSSNDTGIGLGLAIAEGVVRTLGGQLDLSDTPGGGLTASIKLPVEPPKPGH